jgi:hypothetical protein
VGEEMYRRGNVGRRETCMHGWAEWVLINSGVAADCAMATSPGSGVEAARRSWARGMCGGDCLTSRADQGSRLRTVVRVRMPLWRCPRADQRPAKNDENEQPHCL